jgi:hypothetical protein
VLARTRHYAMSVPQERLECGLEVTYVVPNAHSRSMSKRRAAPKIEHWIPYKLPRPMVRELSPALGGHKVCTELCEPCAFGTELVLGLAAAGGIDGTVLKEKEQVWMAKMTTRMVKLGGLSGMGSRTAAEV